MASNDDQVFIPGTGEIWLAPVGTAAPVDLTAPASPWENVGHTSRDDGLTITRDGGDSETLGSWQNPVLRERRDPVTFAVTMTVLQIDNENLSLYFGGGDTTVGGVFGVNLTSVPQQRAMFIRIIDGDNEAPLYIPKVSIASDDDVEVDVEDFLGWPLRCTVLGVTGSNLMEFYGEHLGLLTNEVQQISTGGTVSGGTFTATFDGETTGTIAWNASAAAVKTALAALDNLDAADLTTAGGPLPGTPVTVEFGGQYADTNVPQMTVNGTSLTGSSPTISVTTTTPGG